jgi:anthranilate/para-aminobenzoate synthase component I
VRLSEVAALPSFALLGPGWSGAGHLLVTPLEPCSPAQAVLRFRGYEARETDCFSGRIAHLDSLELDVSPASFRTSFDEPRYARGVREIRASIAAGDVYQVNLTTRVLLGDVPAGALFSRLCQRDVPRFAAWVRAPEVEFVSASPELFFVLAGRDVRVEPMKGTAPAGARAWLEASGKDRAELAMITDLMRNDLVPVCEPRSVRVASERRFIELTYAVQAVSDVTGRLREGLGVDDVLHALHPGGSVTGAPKQAACEMIARLEPTPRGAYCGTLVLTQGERSVASLLIRTAERGPEGFVYGVGAGITWDSRAEAELDELHTKLGALA